MRSRRLWLPARRSSRRDNEPSGAGSPATSAIRSSTDGGLTWGAAADISDATGGTAYKSADGFLEVYGDHGELAITSAGKSIAVFGEGHSYNGPGGVWINRQL